MTMPPLCAYHRDIYATRAARLKNRVHHPGTGRKALEHEARTVAGQCPSCIDQEKP
jgi:hypothetical protein